MHPRENLGSELVEYVQVLTAVWYGQVAHSFWGRGHLRFGVMFTPG
jgi:hypothetical protein